MSDDKTKWITQQFVRRIDECKTMLVESGEVDPSGVAVLYRGNGREFVIDFSVLLRSMLVDGDCTKASDLTDVLKSCGAVRTRISRNKKLFYTINSEALVSFRTACDLELKG